MARSVRAFSLDEQTFQALDALSDRHLHLLFPTLTQPTPVPPLVLDEWLTQEDYTELYKMMRLKAPEGVLTWRDFHFALNNVKYPSLMDKVILSVNKRTAVNKKLKKKQEKALAKREGKTQSGTTQPVKRPSASRIVDALVIRGLATLTDEART